MSATRTLLRSPATAVAASLTLAATLGIGTSLFVLVDATLLAKPPFAKSEALVLLGEVPADSTPAAPRTVSYSTFVEWKQRSNVFISVEAFDPTNLTLSGFGVAERVSATNVTAGFFDTLGVTPVIGRTWRAEETGNRVAIVAHDFWRTKLNADPQVYGREIVLGSEKFQVIGVLPPSFQFALNPSDIWLPLSAPIRVQDGPRVRVLGRLTDPTTPTQAALALDEISRRSTPPSRAVAVPLQIVIGGNARSVFPLLLAAALLAIAIAVVNLMGLFVVRSMDRYREFALRRALGAKPRDIFREVLVEAHLLVAAGAIAGVLLAAGLTPVIARLAFEQFGTLALREATINWRASAAAALSAWVCAMLSGLAPAVRASRMRDSDVLRRGTTAPPRQVLLRRLLLGGQITIAFVLLAALALVAASLHRASRVNPGFSSDGVLTMRVSLPVAVYPDDVRAARFYVMLHEALVARLGSRDVSIIDELPLTGDRGRSTIGLRARDAEREAVVRVASDAYFDVMRIPVLEGRAFTSRDDRTAPPRVIISRALASELFAETSAVGRSLWLGTQARSVEIVGVVGDVKHRALDEGTVPSVYLPAWQQPSRSSHIVVRMTRGPGEIADVVGDEVRRLDSDLPIYAVRSMDEIVRMSPGMPMRRVMTATFAGFALLALVIAGMGLFGLLTHDVNARRAELALRLALGASPADLQRVVWKHAAFVVAPGMLVGLPLSFAAAGVLRKGVPDVHFEVRGFAAIATTVAVVSIVSTIGPLRRTLHTDPAAALRTD